MVVACGKASGLPQTSLCIRDLGGALVVGGLVGSTCWSFGDAHGCYALVTLVAPPWSGVSGGLTSRMPGEVMQVTKGRRHTVAIF